MPLFAYPKKKESKLLFIGVVQTFYPSKFFFSFMRPTTRPTHTSFCTHSHYSNSLISTRVKDLLTSDRASLVISRWSAVSDICTTRKLLVSQPSKNGWTISFSSATTGRKHRHFLKRKYSFVHQHKRRKYKGNKTIQSDTFFCHIRCVGKEPRQILSFKWWSDTRLY